MPYKRKSVEELYEEVKDYDLVLTSDPALADALNKRIDKPRIGMFAETFKSFVLKRALYNYEDFADDDFRVIEKLHEYTKNFFSARFYFELIESCWNFTGNIGDDFYPIPKFLNVPKKVFSIMKSVKHYYTVADKELFKGFEKIAVIGYGFLSEFEKAILPERVKKIDLFFNKEYRDFNFYYFDSYKNAILSIAELINKENQDLFGIVAAEGSAYSTTLKEMLYEKGIYPIGNEDVRNDINFKRLMYLFKLANSLDIAKVRDGVNLLHLNGISVDKEHYDIFLKDFCENPKENYDSDKIKSFHTELKEIPERTFGEIQELMRKYKAPFFEKVVKYFGFEKKKIKEHLDDLEHLINHFGYRLENIIKGVLFADAKSAWIIDRPVIFFVFPDNNWIGEAFERVWENSGKKLESDEIRKIIRESQDNLLLKDIERFYSLVQSGNERYFIAVNDINFTPCYYFAYGGIDAKCKENEIFSFEVNKKKEPLIKRKSRKTKSSGKNFTFSASSFNSFFVCPKKYMFKKLIDSSSNLNGRKGSLVHDFAEFYFNYPEKVKGREDVKKCAKYAVESISGFIEDFRRNYEYEWFFNVMMAVKDFIDGIDREVKDSSKYNVNSGSRENVFKSYFGAKKVQKNAGPIAEAVFEDINRMINGRIDLLLSDNEILDYKTSSSIKKAKNIVKNCREADEDADFQAIFYIYFISQFSKGKKIIMRFYYPFLEFNEKMRVKNKEKKEINKNEYLAEVIYVPFYFKDYAKSKEYLNDILSGKRTKGINKLINFIGQGEYFNAVKDMAIDWNSDWNKVVEELSEKLFDACKKKGRKSKDLFEKSRSFANAFVKKRNEFFFKDDMDYFRKLLKEKFKEIENSMLKGFDKNPISVLVCDKCEFRDICDTEVNL